MRSRRTSRNVHVDGYNVVDTTHRGVVFAKDATTDAAGANSDHNFRFWHSLVGLQQGELHIPGDRPGNQEHVGVTRRGNEVNAEALKVVDGIVQGNDFEFASIARTCIHFSNGKRTLQEFLNPFARLLPNLVGVCFEID